MCVDAFFEMNEIMLQGFWDKTLAAYLTQEMRLPKACIDVKAKGKLTEKAPQKAHNICRA